MKNEAALTKTPVSNRDRVKALRQKRKAMGIARLEVCAHVDDHEAIRAFADELQRQRLGATVAEINYADPIDYRSHVLSPPTT